MKQSIINFDTIDLADYYGTDILCKLGIMDRESLSKIKNDTLIECIKSINIDLGFSIPYSNKTKSQMIKSIKEAFTEYAKKTDGIDSNLFTVDTDEIISYLFTLNNPICDILTKSVIKKIALSPKMQDGKTACEQLYKNRYNEIIFDDIKQAVSMKIFELVKSGYIYIHDGFPVFCDEEKHRKNEDGMDEIYFTSSFVHLFKSVRTTLKEYKQADSQKGKHGVYCIEIDSETGKEHLIGIDSHKYRFVLADMVSFDDIVFDDTISCFWENVRKEYPKKYHALYTVFCGLIQGLNTTEIARTLGVSKRTVERLHTLMKVLGQEYGLFTDNNTCSETYTTTTCNGGTSASDSYEFCYALSPVNHKHEKSVPVYQERTKKIVRDGKAEYIKETVATNGIYMDRKNRAW